MSLTFLATETVTVVTVGQIGTDRYNNPTIGETGRVDYYGWLEQQSGQETVENRDLQVGDWLCVLHRRVDGATFDMDVAMTGRDRVEARNLTFQIIGPPAVARSPRGQHHIELHLRQLDE
ncbi:MAG: hypothetical protein P1T08_12790 [Acidimicrobiia bacterium]|nr:hypothetical protein [Acidimicrobiia bacterium]